MLKEIINRRLTLLLLTFSCVYGTRKAAKSHNPQMNFCMPIHRGSSPKGAPHVHSATGLDLFKCKYCMKRIYRSASRLLIFFYKGIHSGLCLIFNFFNGLTSNSNGIAGAKGKPKVKKKRNN